MCIIDTCGDWCGQWRRETIVPFPCDRSRQYLTSIQRLFIYIDNFTSQYSFFSDRITAAIERMVRCKTMPRMLHVSAMKRMQALLLMHLMRTILIRTLDWLMMSLHDVMLSTQRLSWLHHRHPHGDVVQLLHLQQTNVHIDTYNYTYSSCLCCTHIRKTSQKTFICKSFAKKIHNAPVRLKKWSCLANFQSNARDQWD